MEYGVWGLEIISPVGHEVCIYMRKNNKMQRIVAKWKASLLVI